MEIWVILTFLYAMVIGWYNCSKKKAIEKNSIYEVLAFFSTIAFVLAMVTSDNVFGMKLPYLGIILVKSVIVLVAWIIAAYAMSKMPVSLYGVIILSKMIFSMILSIILLGETMTINIFTGMIIVMLGLILVNTNSDKNEKKETSLKTIILLLFSCLLSSTSGAIDKKILADITSSQLQFWFLLFLTIEYWVILIVKQRKINLKVVKNNYWILIMAITLVVGDRLLFIANEIPESKFSVMTILRQVSAIEMILLGKIMFKENKIVKKLLCSILIIIGIAVALI